MPPKSSIVTQIPDPPDFLGTAGRVKTVSDLIELAQSQMEHFEGMRLINVLEENDKIPTAEGVVIDSDTVPTFKERIGTLRQGIKLLWEKNDDIRDELIAEALKRRRTRENSEH